MKSFDPDANFARALLASARGDATPPDVPGAWARFAEALASAAPGPVGGRRSPAGDATRPVTPGGGGTRLGAVKWLVIGALAGAASTASVVVRHRPVATVAPATATAPPAEPVPPAVASGGTPTPPPRLAPAATGTVRLGHGRDQREPVKSVPPSTLSAEVSRIDTARTASALGDTDEALRLIDRYHHDFPTGALSPDADVVALEAAAAGRDPSEVQRRAALFLARYPNDPHAARVRALAARAGRR